MRSIYLLFVLVTICFQSSAQNLVANGGFEDENICTEYIKNCAPEAWLATSLYANYYFDQQSLAYEGNHFLGLSAGSVRSKGIRNFGRTRLLCGLRKDQQYYLELYVSSPHDVLDSIGVYFSNTDYMFEKRKFTQVEPQLWSAGALDSVQHKKGNWRKLSWIYTANGAEVYLTIGNFKRVDYTGITKGEVRYEYYFFVDNVSLKPMDANEKLCPEVDSMRKEVYNENARHEMLQKWIYYYTKNPPKPSTIPPTRLQPIKQRIDTLIIPDIFFATASYELSPQSFHVLDSFANELKRLVIDSVVIEGHTDSVGTLAYNEKLSANRAGSVENYLLQAVESLKNRTVFRGFAFLRPAATNKTPQGRQKNRRVEIFVYRRE